MTVKKESTINKRKRDEQVLYIDPGENVTMVRERLEHVPARHVALVIPPQTYLRSHTAWKLLQRRAQELGKDVCIVSSDRQVRAIARSVQFKVAASLLGAG